MDLLYRNNAYISLTAWIIEFLSSHYSTEPFYDEAPFL